jgi:hypothetical protein
MKYIFLSLKAALKMIETIFFLTHITPPKCSPIIERNKREIVVTEAIK